MKTKFYLRTAMLLVAVLFFAGTISAQCTFSGLSSNYCTNSANSPLTTTVIGGVFSGPGIVGTAFSPSVAGPGTHTISFGICAATYSISSVAFAPSPTVGTGVGLTDDSESGALPIGFTFNYYCTPYTSFYISSNGFIEFSLTGNGCCSGQSLPNFANPSHLIAYSWNDLNPGTGGSITYTTLGLSPTRTLVVSFLNIPYYSGGNGPVTSQIKLFETSNIIEIHHTSVPGNSGSASTNGIENLGGTLATVVPGRNATTTWTASSEGTRWTPGTSCTVTQTTVVSPSTISVVGNSVICNGGTSTLTASGNTTYTWSTGPQTNSIAVAPTSNTTYTVSGTNGFGCVANSAITVTVSPGLPSLSIATSTNAVCLGAAVSVTASGALTYTWSNGTPNGGTFIPLVTAQYTVLGQNGCGTSSSVTTISVSPLPVSTLATPSVICEGSSANLVAVSAATGYTWTPVSLFGPSVAVAPLVTTVYTVAASDGTCSGISFVTVSVNPVPTVGVVSSSSMVCAGSTVTLTASGGLNYTWTPSTLSGTVVIVSPTISTLYNVIGDNSFGCTSSMGQAVIATPAPTVNLVPSSFQPCFGASVTLFASGANTYSWSIPGTTNSVVVFPQVTTTYSVTGTNTTTGCSSTKTVAITVYTVPLTVSAPATVCIGGSVTINASGPGITTYTWSTGLNAAAIVVSPATSTVYVVSATTNSLGMSCASSGSVSVTVNPLPSVTAAATRTAMCRNESVTVTATGATNYQWSNANQNPSFVFKPVSTSTTVLSVVGTNSATGCENSATVTIIVSACTGIETIGNTTDKLLLIYPNPCKGHFTVNYDSDLSLNLVNELGQTVQTMHLNAQNNYRAEVKDLANGVYFIVGEKDGSKFSEKIVVTN